jgi:predicted double-glycine peptidase
MGWLGLLLTLQQALWIDVPFVRQEKNGCGSASIVMVMKYWRPETAVDVDEVQRRLYSAKAGGIYAKDMAGYFEAHGYRVFTFTADWPDLEQHLSKGRPLVVSLEQSSSGVPLHYVVVAGIDTAANLVLVNDPANRKLLSISRDEFERNWRATGNWTLLAVPELDLAGEAFREDKLSQARDHLDSALRSNPTDAHTNDFLATIYFLQNNTEAALKYWNRAEKPQIEDIRIDPPLRIDPVLLDRAFTFSRAGLLRLSDFETTQARLEALGVFTRFRMDLSPVAEDRFDVTLRAAERSGTNLWSWVRGLPFQTVTPGFFNVGGEAVNVTSMFRWDPNKRRVSASVDTPLNGTPAYGLRMTVDGRDENWSGADGGFRMKKIAASVELHAVPSGRWRWSSGAAISVRNFSNGLAGGAQLKYSGSLTRTVVRDAAKRLTLTSALSFDAGKLWAGTSMRFAKIVNTSELRWHALTSSVRVGRAIGRVPFDERFMLGFDRDSDLWLRAHSATVDGRKNAAHAASAFLLVNTGIQKRVWSTAWFDVSSGPFVDTGKGSPSSHWLTDSGVDVRFRILQSVGINLSYAKSLSDSRHNLFLSAVN